MKKLLFILSALVAFTASAQTEKSITNKIVPEKKYVFVATTAMPMNATQMNNVLSKMAPGTSANNINLSGSSYDVKVIGDSVIAYLPYFGVAYNAPRNSSEGGIKFTSTDNKYTINRGKKGTYKVTILTKDAPENPRLDFTISENGNASLVVVTNNKQSISYAGYLKEVD